MTSATEASEQPPASTGGKKPSLRISEAVSSPVLIAVRVDDNKTAEENAGIDNAKLSGGKTFYIHRSILTSVSKYFRSALEGNFREAVEKNIDLPDVEVEVFEIFVEWVYSSRLDAFSRRFPAIALSDIEDGLCTSEYEPLFELLSGLYIFADGHEVPELETTVITILFDLLTDRNLNLPSESSMTEVASKVRRNCSLWRLLVDVQCRYDSLLVTVWEGMNHVIDPLPKDLLADMYVRQSRVSRMIHDRVLRYDYELTVCDYHDHATQADREACPRNKKK
ncbi:hypothetical protein K491DRAFT_719929 [Lophiostoma macrostomum CBS 122681]|uniref:BTB domain-containing protein n=1 Tax=Lophiostoma macrostomum CBS 122681 TaxID=1314788 RepID=A0A6A6SWC4_9PLEO|nr:hypothetical protein K491DRAFT_719929 [Lophiostoma macrostomum CBS 122681]